MLEDPPNIEASSIEKLDRRHNFSGRLLERVIIFSPLTVAPEVSVDETIAQMHQARTSYALVVEQNQPVGIFTERDIVRTVALNKSFSDLEIAAVMTPSVSLPITSKVTSIAEIFAQMREQQVNHLSIVDDSNQLVGIITKRSLRQAMNSSSLLKFRSVAEVMAVKLVCLPQSASVMQAARQMAEREISCVIITDSSQRPVGIITERDIVQFKALAIDIYSTAAEQVMSTPLLPVSPQDSLWQAHQQMNQHHVRRLVVCTPEGELAGLVTQGSLLQGLNSAELQQIIELLEGEVGQLRSENQVLLEAQNQALKRSQANLSNRLKVTQREQKLTEDELTVAYKELEKNYDELTETNETLNATLKELQHTQQALKLANADLEKRVERRTGDLRRAERRWRSLLEEVHLVVIGLDCDGRVNYANPFFLQLTGYSAEEVLQKYWFRDFVPPDDYDHTYAYFQEFINDGDLPPRYQNAILTRTGGKRVISWHNAALRDRTDTIIGTMSIGEDITQRLAVDRMKGEFISVISHELRTPLTAIHGGIQMIAGGLVPRESEQGRQLLQVAAESSQRLVRLVNDILELERLESGKVLLKKDLLNSQSLTHQVTDTFGVMAQEKSITLTVLDPGIEMVADRDRLIQVLTNLLDNAIKFSPEHSKISLSVEVEISAAKKNTPAVLFKVKDEGRGIPAGDLAEIFERFTQVNSSDSREKGGTGLGLAICHNIVSQHGGKIWVESTLGQGSCFQFTIPQASNFMGQTTGQTTGQILKERE